MPEMEHAGEGIYKEGEIVLVQVDTPYEGLFAVEIVTVKQSFVYREKWNEWDEETGIKHRSERKFLKWLIEKNIFVPMNYNTFNFYDG